MMDDIYSLPPTPYSLQGTDAVERWFTETEMKEMVEFANRMAV